MDEPDVCMDAHSRNTSLDLLLETCQDARTRQFMLITPQDVSVLNRQASERNLPKGFVRFHTVKKRDDL